MQSCQQLALARQRNAVCFHVRTGRDRTIAQGWPLAASHSRWPLGSYGGLEADQVRQLRQVQEENARLTKPVTAHSKLATISLVVRVVSARERQVPANSCRSIFGSDSPLS